MDLKLPTKVLLNEGNFQFLKNCVSIYSSINILETSLRHVMK